MRHLPLLISLGLLAACGKGAPSPEDGGASASGNAVAEGAPQTVNNTVALTAEAAGDAALATSAAPATPAAAPQANKPEVVKSLPLKRGFYVSSDTSCAQASNATLMLVKRDGINSSRTPCEFKKIEKAGPTSYRVTESCNDNGSAWGHQDTITTEVSNFEIRSDTAFTAKSDSGWEKSARYCAQRSLPEPWRDNDIADIIN
jgi:hypothetical protein